MTDDPRLGRTLAGYRIERLIGRGGMGDVYLAYHIHLGAKRALKILSSELGADPEFRERFIRESQLAASLDHANIIPVHDAGEADGLLYIAMRYVDGIDLRELIGLEGELQPARALLILGQIAGALDAAHANGLIHRDVKPGNVMIEGGSGPKAEGHVFLTDFGLVKRLDATTGLTKTGYFVGTLDYAAPEQFLGTELDPRADQYSLGCVLFECLTRTVPFPRENDAAKMYAHLADPPPRVRAARQELPEDLDDVFAKVLAKSKDDRYESCSEFIAAAAATFDMELEAPGPIGLPSIKRRAAPMERKFVTVMFCSLVGLDTLASNLDPGDFGALMDRMIADLQREIEAHGGLSELGIGDSVAGVFGASKAREDDPEIAVKTALAMHDLARRRSETLPFPLQLRIGVVSDLVVAGATAHVLRTGLLGGAFNASARLQQIARPGETLIGQSVWHRVRDLFETEEERIASRDGEVVTCYRVIATREPVRGRLSPLVGREDALAMLDALWAGAERGVAQVVSLEGDPGVGKSRLLSEFALRQGGAIDIRVTCNPERTFGPFLDVIEGILGRLPTDAEDFRRWSGDPSLDAGVAALIAAFFGLGKTPAAAGMANAELRKQMFAGLSDFLLGALGGRPALIALDDLHRAPPSSLDFLEYFLGRLTTGPVMLILLYRPGLQVEPTVAHANHMVIHLNDLTPEESEALACEFLRVREIPRELTGILAGRAEGNPFFIEELLQMLMEVGSLSVKDGQARLSTIGSEIPDTVRGTILARIDRLAHTDRLVLQNASVIGRTFTTELIQRVVGSGVLRPSLDALARAHLLVEHDGGLWSFRNALTEEVTYATLLPRQRRETHRKVAEAMESGTGDDPAFMEILAGHFRQAEESDKARHYALAAGDGALKRMGFIEAKRLYEGALELWGDEDRRGRCSLLMKLGWTSLIAGDATDASRFLSEAEAGWRELGEICQSGLALATLGRLHFLTGKLELAAETLSRAIDMLDAEGPSAEMVQTLAWAAVLHMPTGQADAGEALATRGLDMAEELGLEEHRPGLLTSLGVFEVLAGDSRGVARIHSALDLAEASQDDEAIGRAYFNLGLVLTELARNREGVEACERGRSTMRRRGALTYEGMIAAKQAEMLVELGEYGEAEMLCGEVLGPRRSLLVMGASLFGQMALVRLLTRQGRYENVDALLPAMEQPARTLGGSMFLSPVLTARAELEMARGHMPAARTAVGEAVQLSFGSPAVAHWFRLLEPVARLLSPEEARAHVALARPYATDPWFRACLVEAGAILEADPDRFREAAGLYESLELPYQTARCLLQGGQQEEGADLMKRFGLGRGPLAAFLSSAWPTPEQGVSEARSTRSAPPPSP